MENNFKDLKIFESQFLNEICDSLVYQVKKITGEDLYLVGSVAKIMSNHLPDDYAIKDIDFIVSSKAFRKLLPHRNSLVKNYRMIESRPERIIIYLDKFAIEIWNYKEQNTDKTPKIFNNKIHYLCLLEPKQ